MRGPEYFYWGLAGILVPEVMEEKTRACEGGGEAAPCSRTYYFRWQQLLLAAINGEKNSSIQAVKKINLCLCLPENSSDGRAQWTDFLVGNSLVLHNLTCPQTPVHQVPDTYDRLSTCSCSCCWFAKILQPGLDLYLDTEGDICSELLNHNFYFELCPNSSSHCSGIFFHSYFRYRCSDSFDPLCANKSCYFRNI